MTPLLVGIMMLQASAPVLAADMGHKEMSVERKANPEARIFSPDRDASADVNDAIAEAKVTGKTVMVVMGANWCHDSIALAGWLETPRFYEMMRDRYSIVYVDLGTPQTGNGRNLDIAKRFGVNKVKNSPLVMLLSADSELLNSKKDAIGWRNAASRSEADIFDFLDGFRPDPK